MNIFAGLAGQWILRRVLEVGGWIGTLVVVYQALPLDAQQAITQLLSGDWERVSLGALVTIGAALWGYVWSWKSTMKPQVVEKVDGKAVQVPVKELPAPARQTVEQAAREAAQRRPTILERILSR